MATTVARPCTGDASRLQLSLLCSFSEICPLGSQSLHAYNGKNFGIEASSSSNHLERILSCAWKCYWTVAKWMPTEKLPKTAHFNYRAILSSMFEDTPRRRVDASSFVVCHLAQSLTT